MYRQLALKPLGHNRQPGHEPPDKVTRRAAANRSSCAGDSGAAESLRGRSARPVWESGRGRSSQSNWIRPRPSLQRGLEAGGELGIGSGHGPVHHFSGIWPD